MRVEKLGGIFLLIILFSFFVQAENYDESRLPNIVLILVDDMGWGDPGVNNPRSKIPTPNLDRLAGEGMRFTDAHAGTSLCTPSRYATMTGRHCWRGTLKRGIIWGFSPPLIEEGRMTLGKLLQKNGYATACFGKWHMGMGMPTTDGKPVSHIIRPTNIDWDGKISPSVRDFGFDEYYGIAGSLDMPPFIMIRNDHFVGRATNPKHNNGAIGGWGTADFCEEKVLPDIFQRACTFIRGRKGNPQPFFVYLPSPAPHAPCVPLSKYRGRTAIGAYGDYCVEQDDLVGDVLHAIDEADCRENTLVIFASDNGFWKKLKPYDLEKKGHYPSGPYRGYKSEIYEGGHRSPFFVRWPRKIKAGQVSDEPICLTDLLATFADILHVNLPNDAGEDSASFLPILLGNEKSPSVHDYLIHQSADGSLAIRAGKWKLARCAGNGDQWGAVVDTHGVWSNAGPVKAWDRKGGPVANLVQLFDLEKDPHEQVNVSAAHPDVVDQLLKKLRQSIDSGRSVPFRSSAAIR